MYPLDVNRYRVCFGVAYLTPSSVAGMDVPGCGGMNRLGGGKVFATHELSAFCGGKVRALFKHGAPSDRNEWRRWLRGHG